MIVGMIVGAVLIAGTAAIVKANNKKVDNKIASNQRAGLVDDAKDKAKFVNAKGLVNGRTYYVSHNDILMTTDAAEIEVTTGDTSYTAVIDSLSEVALPEDIVSIRPINGTTSLLKGSHNG